MTKNLSIFEVAELADVSIATISRVINNAPGVRKETRERVLEVLNRTNYRINAAAKQLRMRKSLNIGIVVSSIMKDFYSNIAKGIEDVAKTHNYSVFICNSGDEPFREREYLSVLFEKRVDGIIISPTDRNNDLLNQLIGFGIPVCFINRSLRGVNCDRVLVNNRETSVRAVNRLVDKGYRRIAIVSGARGNSAAHLRYRGYLKALSERGIEGDDALVLFGESTIESGYELAMKLYRKEKPDAIYATNEHVGAGVLKYLGERGLTVGRDVGFLMWDDPFWTTLVSPKISVVSQPIFAIGTTAADLLFRRIGVGGLEPAGKPASVILEAELLEREST